MKLLTRYLTNEQYKLILPIWGSCVFIGNFMGNLLSAYILDQGLIDYNCLMEQNPANWTVVENYFYNFQQDLSLDLSGFPHQNSSSILTVSQVKNLIPSDAYKSIAPTVADCRENNWRDVFWKPALAPIFIGLLTFLLTPDDRPAKLDTLVTINSVDASHQECLNTKLCKQNSTSEENDKHTTEKVPSMLEIMKNAGVGWFLALGYFSVKGARYWMYYWAVPLMSSITNNAWDEAEGAKQMAWADTGGAISSMALSVFLIRFTCCGRKWFIRPVFICIIVCLLCIPVIFTLIYSAIPSQNKIWSSFLWGCYGFFMGIPDGIYSGIAANELAIYMGGNIQASLAGFINGLGGFGPFVQSPITGLVNDTTGNRKNGYYVVVVFLILGVVASILSDQFLLKKRKSWKLENLNAENKALKSNQISPDEEAVIVMQVKNDSSEDEERNQEKFTFSA